MQQLALLAAAQDHPAGAGRFAIVAPASLGFGPGRHYQAYRERDPRSTQGVGVFRTLAEALSFLGTETLETWSPPNWVRHRPGRPGGLCV